MRKKIFCLLCFFIGIQSLQAQGNLHVARECAITVLVTNPSSKKITVDISPILLSLRKDIRTQKRMLLDDNNKGTLMIQLKGPSIIKLMGVWPDSNVSYIGIPGANLVIRLDGLRKDTSHNGDTGPHETQFYDYVVTKSDEFLKTIPQKDPESFLKIWKQGYNDMQDLVTAAKTSGMAPDYTSWISQSIQSLFQSRLCRQLVTYITMTRQWPVNMEEYINNVSSLTTVQFNQPEFFNRETDKELAESYYLFFSLVQDWKKNLPAPGAETTYRNAINYAKRVKEESSRDVMLRYLVTSATANTTDTGLLQWMRNTIVFSNSNKHLDRFITEKQNLLRRIGQGKAAPYFQAVDISGNKFSYGNYRGKYLFIDIWATWCIPCLREIPYLEQLKKEYAGQPIEFVSVSIDKNVDAWKRFMDSTENKDQFHSMPGQASSVSETYNASLIPAFVLIDQQGKVINPASFRPSDPALQFLLDKLLQKKY